MQLFCPVFRLLDHSYIPSFINLSIRPPITQCALSFHSFHSFIQSFIHLFANWFIYSLVHSQAWNLGTINLRGKQIESLVNKFAVDKYTGCFASFLSLFLPAFLLLLVPDARCNISHLHFRKDCYSLAMCTKNKPGFLALRQGKHFAGIYFDGFMILFP